MALAKLNKNARFSVILETLAAAEERQGGVSLHEMAEAHELTADELRELIEPVIYCEFRDAANSIVGNASQYLVQDDYLMVTGEHWLRNLDARTPAPHDAFRLMLSGMVAQSVLVPPLPALDRALAKLASVVAADVVVDAVPPQFFQLCERAQRTARVLRIRYFSELRGEVTERWVEPGYVGSRWRNWYLVARTEGTDEVKTYRIDRILAAELTDRTFVPFDADLAEWFDFEEHQHQVRLRMPRGDLDRIPLPSAVTVLADLDDDRVEVEVAVVGEHRLDDLLMLLGAGAEIVAPEALRARRADLARQILARYEGDA